MFGLAIGHLSILLAIPVLGAGLLIFMPRRQTHALFAVALFASALNFLWSVKIFGLFDGTNGNMQLVESLRWMPSFGINYIVGIDGISLFLVLLTTLLTPIAILASWSVQDKVKEYLIFMLLLETGMLGAFVALDLFLFYVFWEVMLVPMYFLIGVWGGTRRIYAALKFVVYTMAGSLLMLVAIIYLATSPRADRPGAHFRFPETLSDSICRWSNKCGSFRLRFVVRNQGAAVSLSHLATRRSRRSADGGLGDPCRRAAQARHLRFSPLCHAAFS